MTRRFTDSEVKELLSKMSIIVDTREQENKHILSYFDDKKIPYIKRKIDSGDYSAQVEIDGVIHTIEGDVVIEKKNSLDEIAGNFSQDRERFEREFLRAKANGTKTFLLVENASYALINSHAYRSKLSPKSFLASLLAWQIRYRISIVFCSHEDAPQIIYGILYYAMREELEQ